MRVVTVRECLIAILIHRDTIQAMAIREICIQDESVVRPNAVGHEGGVVVGLSKTRPVEKICKLSRGVCRRTQCERRLNSVKHVPWPLVRYVPCKPAEHPGGAARLTLAESACAIQGTFE